jgi:hypothetical protein
MPRLDKDYQKSDIYLIRWLRAKNFNIRAAEEMLIADLKWRKNEKMDNIDQEDWYVNELGLLYIIVCMIEEN